MINNDSWLIKSLNRNKNIKTNNDNRQYLYTVLRDQPIWKLIRFWNAAFFDAVQYERDNYYEHKEKSNQHYDWQFHANLTFGLLG